MNRYSLDIAHYEEEREYGYQHVPVANRLKPYKDYLKRGIDYVNANAEPVSYKQVNKNWIHLEGPYSGEAQSIYEYHARAEYIFKQEYEIRITDHNEDEELVQVEKMPKTKQVIVRPNSYALVKQRHAIHTLKDHPKSHHEPLCRLLQDRDKATWPKVNRSIRVSKWFILTDPDREGAKSQRKFVRMALNTPDYALLEGPPGSGKTTALCELVLQLVSRKKRVLFCASTHVAVDNLLEKLEPNMDDVIAVRVGESKKVSEITRKYAYNTLSRTIKQKLGNRLRKIKERNGSQNMMLDALTQHDDTVDKIIRASANLVCGTTIGILQYPDIKHDNSNGRFDMMIIDEASKTTFQEFLVPAMYADRWIVAGDIWQLSPYTDQGELAGNINACLPDEKTREVCLDVFEASKGNAVVVASKTSRQIRKRYEQQCEERNVELYTARKYSGKGAGIITGDPADVAAIIPHKRCKIRNSNMLNHIKRIKAWGGKKEMTNRWAKYDIENDTEHDWGRQVAWRMVLNYQGVDKYGYDIKLLLPHGEYSWADEEDRKVSVCLDAVKNIAMSSVLESLQRGYRDKQNYHDTAMENGIPESAFEKRHVLLEYQHRMHPDIAAFSSHHVYHDKALLSPDAMFKKRGWGYARYRNRRVLIITGNDSRNDKTKYQSKQEARKIIEELEKFVKYASKNKRPGGGKWEVAVLVFYADQENIVREHLREFTMSNDWRRFTKGEIDIKLCTVDAIQGQEADLVFISFSNNKTTPFLDNLNRINVSVTRARFQCVILANKALHNEVMKIHRSDSMLKKLFQDTETVSEIEGNA